MENLLKILTNPGDYISPRWLYIKLEFSYILKLEKRSHNSLDIYMMIMYILFTIFNCQCSMKFIYTSKYLVYLSLNNFIS